MATTNRLTNANIYLDGSNYLGKAEEVSAPDVKAIMADNKAIGMFARSELPAGLDKMEAKIKWNAPYLDSAKKMANMRQSFDLQIRTSLETHGPTGIVAEVPNVYFIKGTSKNYKGGDFKQHDNVESETMINVTYFKHVINGTPILEIDVLANIYKVDGVDLLAQYRANLGI